MDGGDRTTIDAGTVSEFLKAADRADRVCIYITTINKYLELSDDEVCTCTNSIPAGMQLSWMVEESSTDVTVSMLATAEWK
jgi:hypothetical protein